MKTHITRKKRTRPSKRRSCGSGLDRRGVDELDLFESNNRVSSKRKVLVLDDDPGQLIVIEQILALQGYDTITAGDAEAALELLRESLVDCVVSDVMMPGLSGQEFVEQLRTIPGLEETPVIMVTAGSGDAELELIQCGADMLCLKRDMKKMLPRQMRLLLN